MAIEVRLPQLGQTMEEGVVVELFVKAGDEVKRGEVIYEIETDKATLEVESPADGFVNCIIAELGQTLKVCEPVMVLAGKGEAVPQSLIDSLKSEHSDPAAKRAAVQTEAALESEDDDESHERTRLPDLSSIKLGDVVPLSRIQKITGRRMLRSNREAPCFYLNARADVTDLVRLRGELSGDGEPKISYNDFLMRALAIGLEKFPIMTGSLCGETIELPDSINIGLSVSAPQGLVVPVVKNVQDKTVGEIARESAELIEKARNNELVLTDLEEACITISNLGLFGVESFIPIVVPGQCSILGVGEITDTAVWQGAEGAAVRKFVSLTLSVDHRIANGAYAAQFLDFVRKVLEDTANFT